MLATVKERAASLRSLLYDVAIVSMTSRWYREVLLDCPVGAALLDVGIGTATSLIANRDVVVSKQLSVTGVDYDPDYVRSAQANIAARNMQDAVRVEYANIHEFNRSLEERFDVVYFSGSFMLLPDQSEALKHCARMLRSPVPKVPDGCNIFFTQTFERRTLVGRYITPLLKRLLRAVTTIDFGEVTFEEDFRAALEKAQVEVVEMKPIRDSYFRTQVVVKARPRLSKPAR